MKVDNLNRATYDYIKPDTKLVDKRYRRVSLVELPSVLKTSKEGFLKTYY
jgi:hypothetical protein